MRTLGVVVDQPCIEIGLQRFDSFVEGLAHLHPEELVEDCAVEALDEAVGPGRANLGAAVLDAIQVEVELVGVTVGPAELPSVARWELIVGGRLWPPAEPLR